MTTQSQPTHPTQPMSDQAQPSSSLHLSDLSSSEQLKDAAAQPEPAASQKRQWTHEDFALDGLPMSSAASHGSDDPLLAAVEPFQLSAEMASDPTAVEHPAAPPTPPTPRRFPALRVALLLTVLLLLVGTGGIVLFAAAPAHPARTTGGNAPTTLPSAPSQAASAPKKPAPTPAPGKTATHGEQATVSPSWVPVQLPATFSAAQLSMGDAVEALRTAITFTDREMSLDFRSVGTRAHHAGTFTAATFLFTQGGMTRFVHNDVRLANNTLFDRVQEEQRIQAVVDVIPQLTIFQTQGNQQFVWVTVSFHLFVSKLEQGKRVEGLEIDPGTGKPRLHQMTVLLVHVPPTQQGANPPMGGTGWLVSDYALDLAAGDTLQIVQPV